MQTNPNFSRHSMQLKSDVKYVDWQNRYFPLSNSLNTLPKKEA